MVECKDEEINILLSQWQTCVEMSNAVSERRDNMNNLFVTLNLAVIAALSFVGDVKTMFLLIAGMAVCVVWLLLIRNFKELNKAKFNVINTIEEQLPCQAFKDEWEYLTQNEKYIEGTNLEKTLPIAFLFLYLVALCVILRGKYLGG